MSVRADWGTRAHPVVAAGDGTPLWNLRARFLATFAVQAPELWTELRARVGPLLGSGRMAAARAEAARWARACGLAGVGAASSGGGWVPEALIERLGVGGAWRPERIPVRRLGGWDPFSESEAEFDARIARHKAAIKRLLRRQTATSAKPYDAVHDDDLRLLARRVLGASPEKMAADEVGSRRLGELKRATYVHTRANEIRKRTRAVSDALGLELRELPRGRKPRGESHQLAK